MACEVTLTMRRIVYLNAITPSEGEEAFESFLRINVRLSHRRGIFPLAWRLAKQFNRPRAYDTAPPTSSWPNYAVVTSGQQARGFTMQ